MLRPPASSIIRKIQSAEAQNVKPHRLVIALVVRSPLCRPSLWIARQHSPKLELLGLLGPPAAAIILRESAVLSEVLSAKI